MKNRLLGLSLAVLTVLAFAMNGHGEETSAQTSGNQTEEAKPPEAPAPEPGLLMSLLGKAGLAKPLDKAGINIYGYAEGGYFHDFSRSSPDSGPTFIGLNNHKNAAILDKVSLSVERAVDPAKKKFDLGFHVEGIYGANAVFAHSNGYADTQTGPLGSRLVAKRYGFKNATNPTINNTATAMIIIQTQIETLLSFLSSIGFTPSHFVQSTRTSDIQEKRPLPENIHSRIAARPSSSLTSRNN